MEIMKTKEAIEEFKRDVKKLYGNRLKHIILMALMREVAL